MPIGSGYENASLDGMVAAWTAGVRWALFDDMPVAEGGAGIELSGNGYTSPAFAPSDFAAAVDGSKDVAAPVSFGAPTDSYDEVGTHWAILDASGGVVFWDDLDESQVVAVDAAAPDPVTISPSIVFGQG